MKYHNICIIGGGSTAHTIIPLLSSAGKSVSILTNRPSEWNKNITTEYTTENGSVLAKCTGVLHTISNNPKVVIPNADIIILCLPVSAYRIAIDKIAHCINPERNVLIGTVYGQGGFNWMIDETKKKFNLKKLEYFAIGLVPWICRQKEYGKIGVTYGPKVNNMIALSDVNLYRNLFDQFLKHISLDFFNIGKFHLVDNFLSLTFSVDNQIIHTSRLYSLCIENNGGRWKRKEDVPFFYRDYDDFSAEQLSLLDADYELIRTKIKKTFADKKFTYMLNYMDLEHFSYESNNNSILDSFINSKTLRAIKTPCKENNGYWEINKQHRFFSDDIYYGLCIAKWFSEKLKLQTPQIDKILHWAQQYLNDPILKDYKLIEFGLNKTNRFKYGMPSMYGISELFKLVD